MAQFDRPPMATYTFKLMLMEAIKCYYEDNKDAIRWLEKQMFNMVTRWEELNKRDK